MSQHDYVIANQTFPNFRTDLNSAFAASVSQNSGASAPSTTYAYQLWYDTGNDILKMRNADNDAWIDLFTVDQTADTATAPSVAAGSNLIINGKFSIFQRGTGATTVNGNDVFAADRFKGWANGGGTYTVEQSTDVPNNEFEYSAKLTNTGVDNSVAAGDNYRWATDIEGYNVSQLAYGHSDAKAVTLSFWVKSSLAGSYCGALYSTTASRHYIYEYTISSANTWEKKTITVSSGDTTGSWNKTNGNGLRIYWGFGSGSNYQGTAGSWAAGEKWETSNQAAWIGSASATFFITGVQLEVGNVANPVFQHESYGDELARCQRYYEKSLVTHYYQLPTSSASQVQRQQNRYQVQKRASATLTQTKDGGSAATTVGNIGGNLDGILHAFGGNNGEIIYFSWTADSEL